MILFQSDVFSPFFRCNITSFWGRNHGKFHFRLSWIQLRLLPFQRYERGMASQVGNPWATRRMVWKISVQTCRQACFDGEGVEPLLSWSDQCDSYNCAPFLAASISAHQDSLTYVLLWDLAVSASPSAAAFCLIDPFCSRLGPKEEVNMSS